MILRNNAQERHFSRKTYYGIKIFDFWSTELGFEILKKKEKRKKEKIL